MQDVLSAIGIGLGIFLFGVAAYALLFAWPIQLLWNDLMPSLFGLREISFGEAIEMGLLAGLLFKSYSGHSKKESD